MAFCVEDARDRSPRMGQDDDLVLVEARAQPFDEFSKIGHVVACVLMRGLRAEGIERLPGVALVPVDDQEALLERAVVVAEQGRLAGAGPAMNPHKNWCGG